MTDPKAIRMLTDLEKRVGALEVIEAGGQFTASTNANETMRVNNSSDSQWSATINAVAGAVVTYNVPLVAGNEDCIVPSAAGNLAKFVLHNTTDGDSALISTVNIVANQITLTANAPAGWAAGESIQVNTIAPGPLGGPPNFFDLDLSGFLPASATAIAWTALVRDNAAAAYIQAHPYEVYALSKTDNIIAVVGGQQSSRLFVTPVNQGIACMRWNASGVATLNYVVLRLQGWWI